MGGSRVKVGETVLVGADPREVGALLLAPFSPRWGGGVRGGGAGVWPDSGFLLFSTPLLYLSRESGGEVWWQELNLTNVIILRGADWNFTTMYNYLPFHTLFRPIPSFLLSILSSHSFCLPFLLSYCSSFPFFVHISLLFFSHSFFHPSPLSSY